MGSPCLPAASAVAFFDWCTGKGYKLIPPASEECVARMQHPDSGTVVQFTLPGKSLTLHSCRKGRELVDAYAAWLKKRAKPGRVHGKPLCDMLRRAIYAHGSSFETFG